MTKLFRNDSPEALTRQQAVQREKKRRKERERQAEELAAQGRGEDTEIAHVADGEIVVPEALQTPEFINALRRVAADQNIPFDSLRVGSRANSINPETGVAEFAGENAGRPYYYDGPPVDGLTVTAPTLRQLPQNIPNSGFYNYGTPGNGQGQYGRQSTIDAITDIGSKWNATGAAPFGVGNMSQQYGEAYDDHKSAQGSAHRDGTGVDIRPIRRDGRQDPVTWQDPAYDRNATQKLVDTLRATGHFGDILFNDPEIRGVTPWDGHDNHLHGRAKLPR